MVVHVDPVLFANTVVDDKSTVVILVRVEYRLGDIVLRERGVSYIGKFTDRNITDVVRFHGILRRVLRRRWFRLLPLANIGDIANRQGAICPYM